ncbi:MAG: hypothetical protein OXB86_00565 [Bdellovibrionales bacterium]|nr:hypothetical protein [Bdellovibrionales bacterium]
MVIEYILLLTMSAILLAASFSPATGPVAMFKESGPVLAARLEKRIMTGQGFFKRDAGSQVVSWK